MIKDADHKLLFECIDETYANIVYMNRKERYMNNISRFEEIFDLRRKE